MRSAAGSIAPGPCRSSNGSRTALAPPVGAGDAARVQRLLLAAGAAVALAIAVVLLWPGAGGRAPRVIASWTRTPGVLNPDVRQETIGSTICVPGWTRTIRPPTTYTSTLKVEQMREYGLGGSPSDYQEDHLISLELGGHPTDARNLWPEPIPRALDVDRVENELNREVCSGEITLTEGQRRESRLKHTSG